MVLWAMGDPNGARAAALLPGEHASLQLFLLISSSSLCRQSGGALISRRRLVCRQVAAELSPGEGLVLADFSAPRALISSLLLRVEALTVQRLLTREQGALLRTLAWQHDFSLLRLYDKVWLYG
jgi:hypothetical protein